MDRKDLHGRGDSGEALAVFMKVLATLPDDPEPEAETVAIGDLA